MSRSSRSINLLLVEFAERVRKQAECLEGYAEQMDMIVNIGGLKTSISIVGSEQVDIIRALTEYVVGGLPDLGGVRYGVVNEYLHNSVIDAVYYPADIQLSTIILAYIYIRCDGRQCTVMLEDNHPVDALGPSSWTFQLSDPGVLSSVRDGLLGIYDRSVGALVRSGSLKEVL